MILRAIFALFVAVLLMPEVSHFGVRQPSYGSVGRFLHSAHHTISFGAKQAAADIRMSDPGNSALATAQAALGRAVRAPTIHCPRLPTGLTEKLPSSLTEKMN